MKKIILCMVFAFQVALIGCDSSSSGSNDGGGSSYTGAGCPISATDFTWERIKTEKVNEPGKAILKYQYKLNIKDNSKMEYINSGLVRWDAYNTDIEMGYTETNPQIFNDGLPTITWNAYNKYYGISLDKKVVFYYNNKQCGDALMLSPNSTLCDIPIISIEFMNTINGWKDIPNIKITMDNVYSNDIKDIYLEFDNGFRILKYNEKIDDTGTKIYYLNKELNQDTYDRYFNKSFYIFPVYADLVVELKNGSQCIKEIFIY